MHHCICNMFRGRQTGLLGSVAVQKLAHEYISERLNLLKVASIVLHALCSSLFDVHDGSCDHCRRYPLHFSPYKRAVMNFMNIKEIAAKCVQNNGSHFE